MDTAYNKYNFNTNVKLIRLLFHIFNGDEEQKVFNYGKKCDTLSQIDAYMHSDIRKKMDEGDMIAHSVGDIELYNQIDISNCPKRETIYDLRVLHWMADVYCTFQWKYCLYSEDINNILPAKELYNLYDKMRGYSIEEVCSEIYNNYFSDKELPNTPIYKEEEEYDYN